MNDIIQTESGVISERKDRYAEYRDMKIERTASGISLVPRDFMQTLMLAELMSKSGIAVPPHLRGEMYACLAVIMQAMRWDMDPWAIASKSYIVKSDKNPDPKLAWEAQLIAAVIYQRANFKHLPQFEFVGTGQDMMCKVTLTFANGDVRGYESPLVRDIKPKNSPLWYSDQQQQLGYYSVRAAARRWCPQVILGVYDRDEIEGSEIREINPRPERRGKPDLLSRMGQGTEGFNRDHVRQLENTGTVPMDIIRGLEPARSGVNVPGETIGAVRAEARSRRKKVNDEANARVGDEPVAAAERTPDPERTPPVVADGPQDTDNSGVDRSGLGDERDAERNPGDDGASTPVQRLTELHVKLSECGTEKAVRNRWKNELESAFEADEESIKKASHNIINAHLNRVVESRGGTEEGCKEICELIIARIATPGDLFGANG